jgi:hypothetical protein
MNDVLEILTFALVMAVVTMTMIKIWSIII